MRTIFTTILLLGVSAFAFSQKKYKQVSQRLLSADSICIIDYTRYDSTMNIRKVIKEGALDSIATNTKHMLSLKARKELSAILIKENDFAGRYASQRGFHPKLAILLWEKARYCYLELCLSCHDIYASPDFGFEWLVIDPIKADDLEVFFRKQKRL